MTKFKRGAASFYIVAFSTLILLIIAASFAAVIISEVTRTSNDDLSQSAYDSALAGVEDAKLAFYNYRNCKANNEPGCDAVIDAMESDDCNMVARILNRGDGEVEITESKTGNNMSQAYTCVKISTSLDEYRGTLSQSNQLKVIKVKFSSYEVDGKETKVSANDITQVKISWYSSENAANSSFQYTNMNNGKVSFKSLGGDSRIAAPPTISLAMIQTAPEFNFEDFTVSKGQQTNRGMLYLVPTDNKTWATNKSGENYNIMTNGKIPSSAFVKSNDKRSTNLPYVVECSNDFSTPFACSATVDLPKPIGGTRGDDTFYFVVSLPYGKPTTDFALEFFCAKTCMADTYINENGEKVTDSTTQANLEGVQIKVDSTGRANDLYRRVEVWLENPDNSSLSVMGPLQLLGDDDPAGDELLRKTDPVTCEWNFPNRGC